MVTFPEGSQFFDIKLPITESGIKPKQKVVCECNVVCTWLYGD